MDKKDREALMAALRKTTRLIERAVDKGDRAAELIQRGNWDRLVAKLES